MRKYEIIRSDSAHGLENKVNQYLKEGWDLAGGVAVDQVRNPYTTGDIFFQAVRKDTYEYSDNTGPR